MEKKGTFYRIDETNIVSDKFKKREFILCDNSEPKYPQYLKMEVTQDNCALLDNFTEGEEVTVSINLRGRLWTKEGTPDEKCFNTIVAWKITSDVQPHDLTPGVDQNQDIANGDDVTDDLPFIITILISSSIMIQSLPF